MSATGLPAVIPNQVAGAESLALAGETLPKLSPATGGELCRVVRSRVADVARAVGAAKEAQPAWAALTPVRRGEILFDIVAGMRRRREELAAVVAAETGMAPKQALGEVGGAMAQGEFMAGEGRRFYARTTTSAMPHKQAMTVRQPCGVAGLIIAANTPIANVAWKVFPALICGNAAVLKAAEDTPGTAWLFARIAHEAGLPAGVLNVIQGYGAEAGAPLVADPRVDVVSFTGSTAVGREIARVAGERLAKVALELGGKNPLIVCDDADLDAAARWVLLSAFSNAGQRCAAGSRILVFDGVYEAFRDRLLEGAAALTVGPRDEHDYGPVINERQLTNMLAAVERARERGATVLSGGHRLTGAEHAGGFYVAPTILEGVENDDELSTTELFGPITALYRVPDFETALVVANASPYGLTACIHTRSVHRAMEFTRRVEAGVAIVNGGTYGSEPHMPFGGLRQSGNGWREPGTEALEVYSELKDVYIISDPDRL